MKAVFVELPPLERFRHEYLDDEAFGELQLLLQQNPEVGDVIAGTGGMRRCALPILEGARENVAG